MNDKKEKEMKTTIDTFTKGDEALQMILEGIEKMAELQKEINAPGDQIVKSMRLNGLRGRIAALAGDFEDWIYED